MAPLDPVSKTEGQRSPGDLVLELLRSSNSGLEIRRLWLQAVCKQFSATHALIDNMSWSPSTEAMLFHDMCFWSEDPKWLALEPLANTYSLADTQFEAEHLGEWMTPTLMEEARQPPPMVELLWKPFQLGSGITLSVTQHGYLTGGLVLFRDKGAPQQFSSDELSEQSEWVTATIDLLNATFSMLGHGGLACGAFLFDEDGELWMENAVPKGDEGQALSIRAIVKDFVASNEPVNVQSAGMHSVHLSRLEGQGTRAVLAVSHPLLAMKPSEIHKLSVVERQVMQMAAKGAKTEEIASALSRSTSTVKSHLSLIHISEPTRRTIPSRMPSSA